MRTNFSGKAQGHINRLHTINEDPNESLNVSVGRIVSPNTKRESLILVPTPRADKASDLQDLKPNLYQTYILADSSSPNPSPMNARHHDAETVGSYSSDNESPLIKFKGGSVINDGNYPQFASTMTLGDGIGCNSILTETQSHTQFHGEPLITGESSDMSLTFGNISLKDFNPNKSSGSSDLTRK